MPQADPHYRPHGGFTLYEMLLVMAVSLILLTQGLPALRE
jgi:type IV fimbrial biogenesis protein FimT